jgi:hypothetical protein
MTFSTLLHQYESVPTQKLDGYSPSQLEGMSEAEREKARSMLVERAFREGDIFDLNGLRFVGDETTIAQLAQATDAADRHGWRFDIIRREVLFVLTSDHEWLLGLTHWLDDRNPAAQERAATALASHPLTPAFEPIIVDRIADGRHEESLLGLLSAWIALRDGPGIDPMRFQRNLPLIRAVSPRARPAMLREAFVRPV